jgi:CBS domain-containing protein
MDIRRPMGKGQMDRKLIRDVMHRGVITCWVDETAVDIARRLHENSLNAIFVLDESGRAEGIISQTDLARIYLQTGWQHLTAEEIMTPNVITITGDLPLDVAIQIMLDHHIHRLLIVQGGLTPNRPVGVLSLSDMVREMAGVQ